MYFVSCRSLNSSRKTELGASGHCRIFTSDVSKIAVDRPFSKMRQCANDPHPPYAIFRPTTGVLCKRPSPEFVAKIRIQRQRSSADIYRACEQNCNRPAAFKNATVRERP